MPLQNRVTPFGEIVAIPERGTLMGIRGILHDADGQVRRRWAGRAWLCCLLEFRGRRDPVMAPGHYTRLFFLDEPTAFAAGHRPCAFCRRADYVAFRDTWAEANAHLGLGSRPRATEIDRVLHAERLGDGGSKRLHAVDLAGLPDGAMVTEGETSPPQPPSSTNNGAPRLRRIPVSARRRGSSAEMDRNDVFLIWGGDLWQWSPAGYRALDRLLSRPVLALTPPSVIATLAAGYRTMPPAGLPKAAPSLRAGDDVGEADICAGEGAVGMKGMSATRGSGEAEGARRLWMPILAPSMGHRGMWRSPRPATRRLEPASPTAAVAVGAADRPATRLPHPWGAGG